MKHYPKIVIGKNGTQSMTPDGSGHRRLVEITYERPRKRDLRLAPSRNIYINGMIEREKKKIFERLWRHTAYPYKIIERHTD
ncbi:MAG: hypothetical protein M1470_00265 [Bacteroidetes bacterium]|nr:hypothetical protein [Bacteroidota bacterium]